MDFCEGRGPAFSYLVRTNYPLLNHDGSWSSLGDTMNMASRMQTLGHPGCIHVSEKTAVLLREAEKGHWLIRRQELIQVKGKGQQQTYWIAIEGTGLQAPQEYKLPSTDNSVENVNRLVEWNTKVLEDSLKQVIAHRNAQKLERRKSSEEIEKSEVFESFTPATVQAIPLKEVKEIVAIPEFCKRTASRTRDAATVYVPKLVSKQLHEYVTEISRMYPTNPFHNFGHASQVVMAVLKHMNRIVAPSKERKSSMDTAKAAEALHDNTYGITSDPLTQFSCLFAALVRKLTNICNVSPSLTAICRRC